MSTLNYKKSDDICTIGHYKGFDESDSEEQVRKDRKTVDAIIDQFLSHLHFYNVQTVSGYNSGFSVNIVQQYLCLDEYKDRIRIQKEITLIKDVLWCASESVVLDITCRIGVPDGRKQSKVASRKSMKQSKKNGRKSKSCQSSIKTTR